MNLNLPQQTHPSLDLNQVQVISSTNFTYLEKNGEPKVRQELHEKLYEVIHSVQGLNHDGLYHPLSNFISEKAKLAVLFWRWEERVPCETCVSRDLISHKYQNSMIRSV